jgi:hypothetical protein
MTELLFFAALALAFSLGAFVGGMIVNAWRNFIAEAEARGAL